MMHLIQTAELQAQKLQRPGGGRALHPRSKRAPTARADFEGIAVWRSMGSCSPSRRSSAISWGIRSEDPEATRGEESRSCVAFSESPGKTKRRDDHCGQDFGFEQLSEVSPITRDEEIAVRTKRSAEQRDVLACQGNRKAEDDGGHNLHRIAKSHENQSGRFIARFFRASAIATSLATTVVRSRPSAMAHWKALSGRLAENRRLASRNTRIRESRMLGRAWRVLLHRSQTPQSVLRCRSRLER